MSSSDSDKQILALNAFDARHADRLDPALAERVRRRQKLFGSASVLFYDQPLEFIRGSGCWLYDADGVAYLDAYNDGSIDQLALAQFRTGYNASIF